MSGHRQRKRFNRWVIIGIAVVLAAGLVTIVVPNIGNNDSNPKPSPSPTLPAPIGLTGSAAQLATLLGDARNHVFHATYKVTGDPKVLGGTLVLEWWNKPGHSRVDTTRTNGSQKVHSASLINSGDGANCQQVDGGSWSCQAIAVPAPGDPSGIIGSLTAQLAGRGVSVRSDKVGTRPALCFTVAPSPGTDELDVCVNTEGVLLRNKSATVTYELTSLDTKVPDSIFDPPAKVK